MKLTIIVSVLVIMTVSSVMSSTYFFGEQSKNSRLVFRDRVKYEAIPLKKRIKVYTYNGTLPIKAISCYDYQNSEASVNVTAGGVGYKYMELRLKSQRSYRLDYAIEIYSDS
ncbi:unnamed protein product [Chrysodeixis includens]|uniref:Uncharacterized protein n=1 Tax=Chrysodeixis includens TaxID=689277 RepID=A0A9P0FUV8_CHRIL|nr:unnamed protein product [Chrysodeixis includens]